MHSTKGDKSGWTELMINHAGFLMGLISSTQRQHLLPLYSQKQSTGHTHTQANFYLSYIKGKFSFSCNLSPILVVLAITQAIS